MVSHKMTQAEAWVFNSVNAVSRRCSLGCQLYVADDELVHLRDVEIFYWRVKAVNLTSMIKKYSEEHEKAHDNIQLMSVIWTIRNLMEGELEECKAQIDKLDNEQAMVQAIAAQHSTPPTVSPGGATNSTPNSIQADSINVFS